MSTDNLNDLDDAAVLRLGADLGVTFDPAEDLAAYRARVAAAFNDDAVIDAAAPTPRTSGFTLGGMKLGK